MFVPNESDSGSKRDGIDAPTMSARTGKLNTFLRKFGVLLLEIEQFGVER